MNDLQKIKEVQRLTSAGIVACKSALQRANGDLFEAVASIVSYDDAKLMRSELVSRQAASGDKFPAEQEFVDRLIDRLEPDRELIEFRAEWRPEAVCRDGLWMCFCDTLASAYLNDPNIRHQIAMEQSAEINRFWDIICRQMGQRKRFDLISETITTENEQFLYITLPEIRSWTDAIAIVCEQTNRSMKPRVFQIFSLNGKSDMEGLGIVEMINNREELVLGDNFSIKLNNPCTPELIVKSVSSVANA
jgi:hypothetical protein